MEEQPHGRGSTSSFPLALLSPEIASFPELLLRLLWPCPGSSLLTFNRLDGDSLSQAAYRRWCQCVGTAVGGLAHARPPPLTGGTCITRCRQQHPALRCSREPQDLVGVNRVCWGQCRFIWKRASWGYVTQDISVPASGDWLRGGSGVRDAGFSPP